MAGALLRFRADRHRLTRALWFLAASVTLSCGHDWDTFDPRLGELPGGSSSSTAVGGASSGGGPSSTGTGASGGGGAAASVTAASAGGTGGMIVPMTCGNGTIEPPEECDDGNDLIGDGCATCQVECQGAGEHEDPTTHHCYRFIQPLVWDDAVGACSQAGFHLSSITSQAELDFVRPLLTERVWIGGNEKQIEGTWTWANSEPWSFTAWNSGEPNNGGAVPDGGSPYDEDCLELYDDVNDIAPYGFADFDCAQAHVSLCERKPAGSLP